MKKNIISIMLVIVLISTALSGFGLYTRAVEAEEVADEFDLTRDKYFDYLTGVGADLSNQVVIQKITLMDEAVQTGFDNFSQWDIELKDKIDNLDLNGPGSEELMRSVTSVYNNLRELARVYQTPGSQFYHLPGMAEKIRSIMEYLYQAGYDENYNHTTDWWRVKVGVPTPLVETAFLMHNEMTETEMAHQMAVVNAVVPVVNDTNATWSGENEGTNLVWKAYVVMLSAILTKNADKMIMVRDSISEVLPYKSAASGDGMSENGAFLFHSWIPYNLGYGLSMAADICKIIQVLSDTSWEVTDPQVSYLYEWVENSFEPFIYNGYAMQLVMGREASRESAVEMKSDTFVQILLLMIKFAPSDIKSDYYKMVKTYINQYLEDDTFEYFVSQTPLTLVNDVLMILDSENIDDWLIRTEARNYYQMDRILQRSPDYAVGLAMHSSRTKNFESNEEWVNGYHTANGMMYLIVPNDPLQYTGDYFFTVDQNRLPGTTVSTRTRNLTNLSNDNPNIPKPWMPIFKGNFTGGTTLGQYAAAGMHLLDLLPANSSFTDATLNMEAQKSWFLLDEEIVALGTNINSNGDSMIQTTADTRMLSAAGTEHVVINGTDLSASAFQNTISALSWVYIEGTGGYYFPDNDQWNVEKYVQSAPTSNTNAVYGKVSDIRDSTYVSITKEHGVTPSADSYAYVVLPGNSAVQTQAYSEAPAVEIIANEPAVQMIRKESSGIIAANFWTDNVVSTNELRSNTAVSVFIKEENNVLNLSFSDPTQENNGMIYLEINRSADGYDDLLTDDRVMVVQTTPTIKLAFDASNITGESVEVVLINPGAGVTDYEFAAGEAGFENSFNNSNVLYIAQKLYSVIDNAVIGNNLGDYPQSAVSKLSVVADELNTLANGSQMSTQDADAAVECGESALNIFKLSVVQYTATSYVTEDTSIRLGNYLDENYGSETKLPIKTQLDWEGGNRKMLLKFNVGDNGLEIDKVTLYFTGSPDAGAVVNKDCEPLHIYEVSDVTWKENEITGRNAPEIGAVIALGEIPPKTLATLSYDITDYVKDNYANGTISLAVVQEAVGEGTYYTAYAKEGKDRIPHLVIEYGDTVELTEEQSTLIEKKEEILNLLNSITIGSNIGEYPQAAYNRLYDAADSLAYLAYSSNIDTEVVRLAIENANTEIMIFLRSMVQSSIILPVSEDTSVRFGNEEFLNQNFGSAVTVPIKSAYWSGGVRQGLLKFNIGNSGKAIVNATLYLTGWPSAADVVTKSCEPLAIYAVPDSSWRENSVTGATAPSVGDLITTGTTPPNETTTLGYDITDFVQNNISVGTISMAVIQVVEDGGEGAYYNLKTKEGNSNAPYIVINYAH